MIYERLPNVKKVIIFTITILMTLSVVTAATTTPITSRYLQVVGEANLDYFVFDERGVFVDPSAAPVALREGWMILAGQEPVVLQGPQTTILLQKESMLAVNSAHVERPSFYLVAGSASFLTPTTYLGFLEVSTPAGLYTLKGYGEIFVTSDTSELVFSLGGDVTAFNNITRDTVTVKPFSYLNLADPLKKTKEISQTTYQTLSINPRKEVSRLQPKVAATDELTIYYSAPAVEEVKVVAKTATPVVEKPAPVVVEKETAPVVEKAVPVVSEKVVVTAVKVEEPVAPPVEKVVYDVYIAHTGDLHGQIEGDGIGYARLATLLDWGRSLSDRNLLVDVGNSVSGTPLAEAFEGESVAVLLDMLGYNAIAPSSGDYAYGLERLKEAAELASQFSNIKVLAANILDNRDQPIFEPYGIFNLKGYKVGVIGLSVPPEGIYGITALSDVVLANAQALVDEVKEQSDFVLLIGNTKGAPYGITSLDIAQEIDNIDLIIDGSAAQMPEGGRYVGQTLIVNSDEELKSVGLVAIHVVDGEVDDIEALRIKTSDVFSPRTSALASAFGIEYVPEDPSVVAYIGEQKRLYNSWLAAQAPPKVELPVVEVEEVVVAEAVVEEPVVTIAVAPLEAERDDTPLIIHEPAGISSSPEFSKKSFDFGVTLTYNFTFDNYKIDQYKMGLSINPYFGVNDFSIGLQGFFLTAGEFFSPTTWDVTNIDFTGNTLDIISQSLRFIDYVKYGQKGDSFYLIADDHTPISFGRRTLVNNLGVASNPYEEHLGLYLEVRQKKLGIEFFIDDLYLTRLIDSKDLVTGVRLAYSPVSVLSLGISSLATFNTSRDIKIYPSLDIGVTIVNQRKFQMDAFIDLTTVLKLNPFENTIWDEDGAVFAEILPNFVLAAGFDFHTNNWDFRLIAAAQNNSDGLLSLSSFNSTNFSGERMLDQAAGIYYSFGGEVAYNGPSFHFATSYQIPVSGDFTAIVPLDVDSTLTGDILGLEFGYTHKNFEAVVGVRRVGLISAIKDMAAFNDGIIGMFKDIGGLFVGTSGSTRLAQPYVSLRGNYSAFSLFADLTLVNVSGMTSQPRVTFGATVDLGKNSFKTK